ncbi:MAG: 4-(cytidine 5'-diphospho)-2-C-methyl-D-erythritol kinase [Spirochaetaceae bacterium]|nr:4-(cytidine 5'-diphospho)-2-C-methyl-D-erythritol kinase [Spirochaetaceae bacterium]
MAFQHSTGAGAGNALRLAAPCKINLHLAVQDLRDDGYHNLESLFVTLAFGDTLIVTPHGGAGSTAVRMDWQYAQGPCSGGYTRPEQEPLIPLEKNSVFKAASLFRLCTGFSEGVHITVEKRVPLGSGLGGGSSDAASTLMAMNLLAGSAAAPDEMAEMALELGSDVPFFLSQGGAAWVSGRGEKIAPAPFPHGLSILLVCPDFSSDTAAAFRLLDRDRAGRATPEALSKAALVRQTAQDPQTWTYYNDFLPVFTGTSQDADKPRAGAYRRILRGITESGAAFAGLSGTGSSCFGVFTDKAAAAAAQKALASQNHLAFLTVPLARFSNRVLEWN